MSALPYRWEGDGFTPLRPRLSDKDLIVGQVYWLDPERQRSEESHRHEFAWLREAWSQLPEALADRFPTPEHLRKAALIQGGYFHETLIDCGTNAAALRVASYARAKDGFAHVVVRGPLVVERVAKSQSRRAMEPKEFQDSKTAIIEIVSAMIGVAPETLTREAGRAA
jgi:NDP-sugar pyrophosphorylase family protein